MCVLFLAQVELPWTAMMHDMAITTRFKVLLHVPLTFDPKVGHTFSGSMLSGVLWSQNLCQWEHCLHSDAAMMSDSS
jgi:carotenoid cleavage dioxygenase-like enzyme